MISHLGGTSRCNSTSPLLAESPQRRSVLPVHSAICDHCDQPISGVRLKCASCPDFDLCYSCWGALQEPVHSRNTVATGQPLSHWHDFFFVLPIPSIGRPVVPVIKSILQINKRMSSPRQTIHWSHQKQKFTPAARPRTMT